MCAKITNGFGAGMDQDSSKNKYDSQHYYEANNVRMFTQDGSTSGALEDMEGTFQRLNLTSIAASARIVGHCILRDKIIIFLTNNATTTPSLSSTDWIIQVDINDIESLTAGNEYTPTNSYVHLGGNIIYTGNLSLCIANPIQAVPRYETEYIQKVYWVDGYNLFRYINIVWDEETNDLDNLPEDRLEVIGNVEITQPQITEIISGELKSGKIQYVYQLYSLNGNETTISPASYFVNLTESVANGSDIDVDTGKGIRGTIEIPSLYYTRIRLIAIHYSTLNDEPEVRVFEEREIDPAGETINFIDIGNIIINLTFEEVRVLQTLLLKAGTIETKNNILFIGDTDEDSFDVDFDARAYRFGGLSATPANPNFNIEIYRRAKSLIYDEDLTAHYIIDGTLNPPTITAVSGAPAAGPDWTDIPEDFDCINTFNDLDNDGDHEHRFMYQTDGVTVGGEGPNVKYEFKTEEFTYVYQDDPATTNASYSGPYNDPIEAGGTKVGYFRDEVYRFGIVFFNEKGVSSFVKWIGDIRFPSQSTINHTTLADGQTTFIITDDHPIIPVGKIFPLCVEFSVRNLPAECVGYQIVRVKREGVADRSVLAQGYSQQARDNIVTGQYDSTTWLFNNDSPLFQFHSPEVAFNKNISYQSGDYFQKVAEGDGYQGTGALSEYMTYFVNRCILSLSNPQYPVGYGSSTPGDEFYTSAVSGSSFLDIDDAKLATQDDQQISFASGTFNVVPEYSREVKGICLLAECNDHTSYIDNNVNLVSGRGISNYRRNVFESQYNGYTNNFRRTNEYIACGEYYDKPVSGWDTYNVWNGDTYIGVFVSIYQSLQSNVAPPGGGVYRYPSSLIMVLETNISMNYQSGFQVTDFDVEGDARMIHDKAGVWTDNIESANPNIFVQEDDLHRYNTVYSRENDAKIFVVKPFDWRPSTKFDTRVHSSDTKVNGELTDSWLKFRVNAFKEVDPQHGEITILKTVNEKLLFYQPKAFGVLSVNERALIQTGDISQLSLGTSGVLERYDYAKTNIGCSHWRHVVLTPNAFYWVDAIKQSMYKFTGGIEEVSLMKGMDSWFRDNIVERKDMSVVIGEAMHMFHDPEYQEVYLVDNTNNHGLIYNELTDGFTSFTDLQPKWAINYLEKVLGTNNTSLNRFHRHNDFNAARGDIYGFYREISVTLLLNPSKDDIAIFNNFEWLTEVFRDDPVRGLLDQPITFGQITLWNDYQSIPATPLTVGDNIKRRMRKWRYTVPRSTHERDRVTLQATRYARFRDSHLFAKFYYQNNNATQRIAIHDITTSVNISNK